MPPTIAIFVVLLLSKTMCANTSLCRYIPWIYVGISTRTGISCLRQYLEVVASTGVLPHSIPSDRGTETMIMASAQWRLHQAIQPDIPFYDVWWYGTSTLNQRIEA